MDWSSRQKINREIIVLIDIIKPMGLADTYKTFHPNTKEYVFFLAPH